MPETDKITLDLDVAELYNLCCDDCKHRIREFTRKKIRDQIQETMLDNMTEQALGQIMPRKTPKRVLPSTRNLKAR